MLMGGRAEGLACADPGLRTPIGMSGNSLSSGLYIKIPPLPQKMINWGDTPSHWGVNFKSPPPDTLTLSDENLARSLSMGKYR